MEHAALVGMVHRSRHRGQQPRRLVLPVKKLAQPAGQAGSLDPLHAEIVVAVVLAHLVHRHDVRMVELRDRLGLVAEPAQVLLAREPSRADHLERHDAIEAALACLEDDSHSPLTEGSEQLVVAEVADARSGGRGRCGISTLGVQIEVTTRSRARSRRPSCDTVGAAPAAAPATSRRGAARS